MERHEGIFQGDGYVLYLDHDGGSYMGIHIYQKELNYTLKMGVFYGVKIILNIFFKTTYYFLSFNPPKTKTVSEY